MLRDSAAAPSAVLAAVLVAAACSPPAAAPPTAAPPLTGPYLGQEPPGLEPRRFAPGVVSTGLEERDLAVTPDGDELFFTVTSADGAVFAAIVTTRLVDSRWTPPEVAPFSGSWSDFEPCPEREHSERRDLPRLVKIPPRTLRARVRDDSGSEDALSPLKTAPRLRHARGDGWSPRWHRACYDGAR